MKKIVISIFTVLALLFTSVSVIPTNAHATDFGFTKEKSGSFNNYVNTKGYYDKTDAKYIYLFDTWITSSSKAKGNYTMYIQTKKKGGNWKTLQKISVKKNGKTFLNSSKKFSSKYSYRFKLVNKGSKKTIKYTIRWMPTAK